MPATAEGLYAEGHLAIALVAYITNRYDLVEPLLPGLLERYQLEGPMFTLLLHKLAGNLRQILVKQGFIRDCWNFQD
jgi:hypothetical protein